jgi:predicted TIM-barrel fold metal-dependent hydrolase
MSATVTTAQAEPTASRLFVASADGHAGLPGEQYRPYIDSQYQGDFDLFLAEHRHRWSADEPTSVLAACAWDSWHGNERYESGGIASLWDPSRRLAELDLDGIAIEVLFSDDQHMNTPPWLAGGLTAVGLHHDYTPELRLAGARAYNRWLAEFCSTAPDRFIGAIAVSTLADVDGAIAEVRNAHAAGLRHTVLLPLEYHQPMLHHPRYEPFWQVCLELDLTISIHQGDGAPSWLGDEPWDYAVFMMESFFAAHRPLWCLIFGGVLERHPDLRVVFTEQGSDWLPATLAAMDDTATNQVWRSAREHPMRLLPSDYFRRQCFVADSLMGRPEIELRHAIGIDQMLFGTDFGHMEGMWPEVRARMTELFEGIPSAEVAKLVGENFLRAYKVDRAALEPIVARIGPYAAELGAVT